MAAWRAVVRVLRSREFRSQTLRSPLDAVGCALFPSSCRVCNEPLLHLSSCPVCIACLGNLPPQKDSLCALCGESLGPSAPFRRLEAAQTATLCEICQRLRPAFTQAVAHGLYEDSLRALIHLLKYERASTLARPLGALLAQCVLQMAQADPNFPDDITVVAVPLHPLKEKQRGFNQTALLAEATVRVLMRADKSRHWRLAHGAMGRQRATESQFGLTSHQRRRNLRGAFFVAQPEGIAGRAVLLLDDIYTTGATARECTRTLLAAGAEKVFVATLARSQRESGVAMWDWMPPTAGQTEPTTRPTSF